MTVTNGSEPSTADHLCVLIHGLWGNPEHLKYVSEQLESHFGSDKILTLVCKTNAGNFTYDGIDVGGERAAKEIKEFLKGLDNEGSHITKFSIVGYSLGGLVARYAIGVLDHDGFFETRRPLNFTTFATPHLGARTPLNLWTSQVYNTLGPRVISASGQQIFVMDKFRDSGKPLLELMTDPDSIFMHALEKFPARTVYANIINDRLAPFYTTSISATDAYADNLDSLQMNYIEGYGPVVIDGKKPFHRMSPEEKAQAKQTSLMQWTGTSARQVATLCAMTLFLPIFATGFLATSVVETIRSQRRIQTHSAGEDGLSTYRVTNMLQRVASRVERRTQSFSGKIPTATTPQTEEPPEDAPDDLETVLEKSEDSVTTNGTATTPNTNGSANTPKANGNPPTPTTPSKTHALTRSSTSTSISNSTPKLALLPAQFKMIESLDRLGFQKFHVWIHNSRWSHAAIVVRKQGNMFDEGKVVVRHWLEKQFRI